MHMTTRNEIMSAAEDVNEDTWPDFYPVGVPPKSAEEAHGEFFRLVRSDPPTPHCFLSTHEEYPNRYKKCRGEALQCVYGTSFYSNIQGASDTKAKFPEALGDRLIAKGEVMSFMGVMKKTFLDPAHYTLWLRKNSLIHEHFICTGDVS